MSRSVKQRGSGARPQGKGGGKVVDVLRVRGLEVVNAGGKVVASLTADKYSVFLTLGGKSAGKRWGTASMGVEGPVGGEKEPVLQLLTAGGRMIVNHRPGI